jgi:aubergine-like protein
MSETRQMSRAQKRRAAKRAAKQKLEEEAAAKRNTTSTTPPPAATTAKPVAAVQVKPVTPEKKTSGSTTPPKAISTTPPKPVSTTPPKQVQQVAKAMGDMKISDEDDDPMRRPLQASELPPRMAAGSGGKSCELTSNTFELTFNVAEVYRYVVEFTPAIAPERIKQRVTVLRKFKSQVQESFGQHFFDGTNLVCLARAPEAEYGPTSDGHSIVIRYGAQVSTRNSQSQEVNMYINLMTKKMLRKINLILIGRSYFYPQPVPLKGRRGEDLGLSVYQGFSCAVQPSRCGNLMTVDLCSRVVRQKSVRKMWNDSMQRFRKMNKSKAEWEAYIKATFIGQTVLCLYNNRAMRIDDIDFTRSMSHSFELEESPRPRGGELGERNGEITYREYFMLRYPEIKNKLPPAGHNATKAGGLLVNEPKNQRTTSKRTDLLPELCHLTGLDDQLRGDFNVMKALNGMTRLPPSTRVAEITKMMAKIHTAVVSRSAEDKKNGRLENPCQLGKTPVELKGRVLPDVRLALPRSQKSLSRKDFGGDIRSAGFFGSRPTIPNFGIVHLQSDGRVAGRVASTLKQLASQQGATLQTPHQGQIDNKYARNADHWQAAARQMISKNCSFLVFLNPGADSFIYSVMKNVCTVQNAIVSQCIDSKNLQAKPKMFNPILGNTLKQILAKMGYQNWRIPIAKFLPPSEAKSTMFVGVDVSHDKLLKGSFGSRGRRSTVGFVASRSDNYHAFNSYISYQDPNTEFITEAVRLMTSACTDYHKENKRFPTSVCVYRDGVGDSQLTTFVRREIQMYEDAFASLNFNPKLTVIVVQKRVNLRLFAKCPRKAGTSQRCDIERKCNGRDAYHSPLPGTIVDDTITAHKMSDFYLVPSAAPPGACARPTRFIVMRDDMNLGTNSNNLQQMTNSMTYQYFNWPGPIRVPACVMYAHKAAYLFGKHVTGNPQAAMSKHLFYL